MSLRAAADWKLLAHNIDRPERAPELLLAPLDGFVVVTKAIPVTEQGDCVFVIGQPIDRAALI